MCKVEADSAFSKVSYLAGDLSSHPSKRASEELESKRVAKFAEWVCFKGEERVQPFFAPLIL